MNAKTSSVVKIGRPGTASQPVRAADAGIAAELLRLRRGGQAVVGQHGMQSVYAAAIPSRQPRVIETERHPIAALIQQAQAELRAGHVSAAGRTLEHALAIAD